ncbi:MAG: PAS domain S-box protein [Methylococcaceae bacterium]
MYNSKSHPIISNPKLLYLAKLTLLAIAYILLAKFSYDHFSLYNNNVCLIWLPSGLVLGALLIGGRQYWLGGWIGAFVVDILMGNTMTTSALIALGATAEALLAYWLLANLPGFNGAHLQLKAYLKFLAISAISACVSSVVGVLTLWINESIPLSDLVSSLFNWWQGDTLSFIVLTPLILIWSKWPHDWFTRARVLETTAYFSVLIFINQVVFLDWYHVSLELIARGYWLFPMVFWAALRFGQHGVMLTIGLITCQALYGSVHGVGIFALDFEQTHLLNFWLYMLILTGSGMWLTLLKVEQQQLIQALSEGEAKWFALFNNMRNGFALHEVIRDETGIVVDYRFLEVNPAFEKMTKTPKAQWLGKRVKDIYPEIDKQWLEQLTQVVDCGEIHYLEHYVQKLGSWFSSHAYRTAPDQFAVITEEVTERMLAEITLIKSESRFRLLFNTIPDSVFIVSMEGRILDANDSACKILGYRLEELLDLGIIDIDAPEFKEKIPIRVKQTQEKHHAVFESAHVSKQGQVIPVEINSRIIKLGDTPVFLSIARNISERKQQEASLRLLASVFKTAQESIMITDANIKIIDVNAAFSKISGYERNEVLGKNPRILQSGYQDENFYQLMWQTLKEKDHWKGELRNRAKTGEIYTSLMTISAIKNNQDEITHYIGISIDITQIRNQQKIIQHTAHHDPLTGLPNRLLLSDRLEQAIQLTKRNQNMLAVCYLDLDGFKPINDHFGHSVGDQVLNVIAQRISNTIRSVDTAARVGGDEFVILLLGQDKLENYLLVLDRLLTVIAQPILIDSYDQQQCSVGASIGVSVFPDNATEPNTLLEQADQAMYTAKHGGKNRYCVWNQDLGNKGS